LCEVKTINPSEIEASRRLTGGVGISTDHLNEQFFGKLRSTVDHATKQMKDYNPDGLARRIAYVVIYFDDMLHEYADRYASQLEDFKANYLTSGPEVVLYYKRPFGAEDRTHGG
jgi:hypothetical protein